MNPPGQSRFEWCDFSCSVSRGCVWLTATASVDWAVFFQTSDPALFVHRRSLCFFFLFPARTNSTKTRTTPIQMNVKTCISPHCRILSECRRLMLLVCHDLFTFHCTTKFNFGAFKLFQISTVYKNMLKKQVEEARSLSQITLLSVSPKTVFWLSSKFFHIYSPQLRLSSSVFFIFSVHFVLSSLKTQTHRLIIQRKPLWVTFPVSVFLRSQLGLCGCVRWICQAEILGDKGSESPKLRVAVSSGQVFPGVCVTQPHACAATTG